jgi:hypothetical protein
MSNLLRVDIDGTVSDVANKFEPIREAIGDTISYVFVDARLGVFVNDNGMLTNQPLNPAASMIAGRALYGVCVLCAGNPDENGDSIPLATRDRKGMIDVAGRWRMVVLSAAEAGQDVRVYPDASTIPPARIIPLPDDWLPGDPIPEGE